MCRIRRQVREQVAEPTVSVSHVHGRIDRLLQHHRHHHLLLLRYERRVTYLGPWRHAHNHGTASCAEGGCIGAACWPLDRTRIQLAPPRRIFQVHIRLEQGRRLRYVRLAQLLHVFVRLVRLRLQGRWRAVHRECDEWRTMGRLGTARYETKGSIYSAHILACTTDRALL